MIMEKHMFVVTEYQWAFEIRFGLGVCCIYCLLKMLRSRWSVIQKDNVKTWN